MPSSLKNILNSSRPSGAQGNGVAGGERAEKPRQDLRDVLKGLSRRQGPISRGFRSVRAQREAYGSEGSPSSHEGRQGLVSRLLGLFRKGMSGGEGTEVRDADSYGTRQGSVFRKRSEGRTSRDGALAHQTVSSVGNRRNVRGEAAEAASTDAAYAARDAVRDASQAPEAGKAARRIRIPGWLWAVGFLLFSVLVILLVFFLLVHSSLWLYHTAVTSEFFMTRHIDVTGNNRMSKELILKIGEVEEGMNTFTVTIADVERRLRQTPWVEEVSVKRLLPDRFVIRVKERMPSFWIRRDGRLFYANDRGEAIAPVESENFMSLPMLTIESGGEDAIPYLSRLMKDMRSGVLPVEAGAIATVDVSPSRGVEIYLEDRELRLSLAPDDWDGNLARLGVTIGDLARRRELGKVQEIRAADGSVWVLMRRQAQQ